MATSRRRHGDIRATAKRRQGDVKATSWRRQGDVKATSKRRQGDISATSKTTSARHHGDVSGTSTKAKPKATSAGHQPRRNVSSRSDHYYGSSSVTVAIQSQRYSHSCRWQTLEVQYTLKNITTLFKRFQDLSFTTARVHPIPTETRPKTSPNILLHMRTTKPHPQTDSLFST